MIGSEPRSAEPGTRLAQFDSLPELMRLVHLVPMHLRRFTVTAAAARARHHVGQDLAGLLVAEGLPYVGQGSARSLSCARKRPDTRLDMAGPGSQG